MTDWITAAITALACFGLCGGCVYYLYRSSSRLRWSRSSKTLVLRHPRPTVFWAKVVVVGCGGVLSLSMGVLLLVFHGHRFLHPGGPTKPSLEQIDPDGN